MIKALIFDFDGVVIDTETPDYASWQEIYRSYGAELERSIWQRIIGGNVVGFDVYKHLEDLASVPIDREDVREQRRTLYLEQVEANPILPGVVDYIAAGQRLGLKLGVASSSTCEWVKGHLARRDLLKHFHSIKCADDVSRIKPDPELYLAVVDALDTNPGDAVAIEDSLNGVTAAKNAGLLCIAVPNPMTSDLPLERSDIRLGSLSELTLEALLSKLNTL
jgi:HAD superfamily hydrolase (TIGR01509 family)